MMHLDLPVESIKDLQSLWSNPAITPALGFDEPGLRSIFIESIAYRGKPTRVFAFIGLPETAGKGTVPGMVLIHGGLGTALVDWVRLWVSRGYAAIAMDTCGAVPRKEKNGWARHDHSGPVGWDTSFKQAGEAPEEQWPYHAVAAVVAAHSILAALPEVDGTRIGLTGISWGGYLTCLAASIDQRFKFCAPVYGCGHLDHCAWAETFFGGISEAQRERWLRLWDPKHYLPKVRMSFLWVTGTNDFAYPLNALRASYRLTPDRTLCITLRMAHGHGGPGENPLEIFAFAEHHLRGAVGLSCIRNIRCIERDVVVEYDSPLAAPVIRGEMLYTLDSGRWQDRQWQAIPAALDTAGKIVTATVPPETRAWFVNLIDSRGLTISSEYEEDKAAL